MILTSILDNDLYKFTMQHAVSVLFPRAKAQYTFVNRDNRKFPSGFAEALQHEVNQLKGLRLSDEEKEYLSKACYYLPPTYLDFLHGYRFDPSEVKITQTGTQLEIKAEGYWYRTILWEVPIMALVSELYFQFSDEKPFANKKVIEISRGKLNKYDNLKIHFADFGTRRRYSLANQELVVSTMKKETKGSFIGTSNVYLAMKYQLIPIGTHAHEWFMFHGAKFGYKLANQLAMDNWVSVYRGDLGIALSDTFTSEAFFKTFDTKLAKLFDGVRQDSGDPIEFAEKVIAHYKSLNIDPTSKTIIFSDSLNPEMVEKITVFCRGKVKISYGIGTNLTNDVGVKPLNIVVKLTATQPENQDEWLPTVKLSDSKGKHLGPADEVQICKSILRIED